MASAAPSPTEYVTHHLTHLKVGEGFWSLHVDTLFFSWVLGLLMIWFFRAGAKRATAGVPGQIQNFVETLVEFADKTVRESFPGPRAFMAVPDDFRLGVAVESHGPDPGGLAAAPGP